MGGVGAPPKDRSKVRDESLIKLNIQNEIHIHLHFIPSDQMSFLVLSKKFIRYLSCFKNKW